MAYAAVVSLNRTLEQILINPCIFVRPRDKKHIESLHEKLEFFLEEHPSNASDENVTFLERRIRDAAYEAEDSIDLHLNHLCNSGEIIWQMEIEPMMKQVGSIVGEVTHIKEHMGLKIKRRRLSYKKEEMKKTGEFGKRKDFEPRNAFRKDSSSSAKNLMVGFDDYLFDIKDQLTGQSSALEVISIVGMGGIGKTTLATHLYNDPYVVYHFDVRVWVTVSQSYSVGDILSSILDSMNKLRKNDLLGVDVYQNLKGRRYLIILDDIWDTSAWDGLKMMFPDDKTGSRIMLTSRIADVAAYASPSGTPHQISLLDSDHSWELLCAKVFGDEPCPLNLQEIGMTIAQNCGGLPLSIVVIGGLLSKLEMTKEVWQSISENVTSFVFSSDDRCSALLRLSYNYLPQHLKACFLYLAVFPKSNKIGVSKLTGMWVAEGFLRQRDGQSPEEVAERSVEDLHDRSLILADYKNYEGRIKSFVIHDLLFDFCMKEANDEKFVQIKSPANLFPSSSVSEHRISILPMNEFENCGLDVESMPSIVPQRWNLPCKEPCSPKIVERSQITVTEKSIRWDFMSSMSYVRSFVSRGLGSFVFSNLFLGFKLLRVLDATEQHFSEFPPQILELLNLRYIALLCDGDIPASITKLWSLQTLIIDRYSNPNVKFYLPVDIWIMSHLRHVWCRDTLLLDPSAAATFKFNGARLVLEDLHTLSRLWNLKFTKEMLQRIPNIKKIDVVYDSRMLVGKEWPDYQLENLRNLHQLKALKISVIPYLSIENCDLFHPIFKVHFPPSLKTLNLGGVRIPWHELAIIGSLPNLEVLKLKDDACIGTEWAANEDEFCQLKVLALENLELEHWRAEPDHFPRLQHLIIAWCGNLVKIPSGFGESMTLTTIELRDCKDSVWDSANEIREKQLSDGNDGFQIIDE